MPELPEVETTKTSLKPLIGQRVRDVRVFQPKLRWQMPDDLDTLTGYQLKDVERRAKYLILTFGIDSNDLYEAAGSQEKPSSQEKPVSKVNVDKKLIIHLGMSGSLQQLHSGSEKRKHDHLIIDFVNSVTHNSMEEHPITQLHYHDPRRFGAILWYKDYANKLFDHLGIEPLNKEFTGNYLYRIIQRIEPICKIDNDNPLIKHKTKRPINRSIKAVIMDQHIVVGVGNIYATECLFLSFIHPSTPANILSLDQLNTIVKHIKIILNRSIELGGSTLRDFTVADGTTGYFQQTLHVYGKLNKPCPICTTAIEKVVITGRASTFCPQCQSLE